MRHDVFTNEEEILFMDRLTDFLNQGEVGAMLHKVYAREVAGTELEGLAGTDQVTEAQEERILNIECALRNWLLLKYVQQNI